MRKSDSASECCDMVTFHEQSTYFLSLHMIWMGFFSAYNNVKAGFSPETLPSVLSVFWKTIRPMPLMLGVFLSTISSQELLLQWKVLFTQSCFYCSVMYPAFL